MTSPLALVASLTAAWTGRLGADLATERARNLVQALESGSPIADVVRRVVLVCNAAREGVPQAWLSAWDVDHLVYDGVAAIAEHLLAEAREQHGHDRSERLRISSVRYRDDRALVLAALTAGLPVVVIGDDGETRCVVLPQSDAVDRDRESDPPARVDGERSDADVDRGHAPSLAASARDSEVRS